MGKTREIKVTEKTVEAWGNKVTGETKGTGKTRETKETEDKSGDFLTLISKRERTGAAR